MNIKMTVDLGEHKSGFCIFDADTEDIIHHGCLYSPDARQTCYDIFAIANNYGVKEVIMELSHRKETIVLKMARQSKILADQYGMNLRSCTAAEWRQPLHIYTKKKIDTQKYKELALAFVEKNLPEEYKPDMQDDEAEAICMAKAYMIGLKTHLTMKDRRNQEAKAKKQYYKQERHQSEEAECYDDEPIEYRKLYM